MKKIYVALTICMLLLFAGCADGNEPAQQTEQEVQGEPEAQGEVIIPQEPDEPEEPIEPEEPAEGEEPSDMGPGVDPLLAGVEEMTFTIHRLMKGDDFSDVTTEEWNVRIEDGIIVEFSRDLTNVINGNTHATTYFYTYFDGNYAYTDSYNPAYGSAKQVDEVQPGPATYVIGQFPARFSEHLWEMDLNALIEKYASRTANRVSFDPTILSHDDMVYTLFEMTLDADGRIASARIEGHSTGANVTDTWEFTSYTEATIEVPEDLDRYPAPGAVANMTAIGVANDFVTEEGFSMLTGHFIMFGVAMPQMMVEEDSLALPSSLVLLELDSNTGTFINPITLTPQANSGYFFNTEAKSIDGVDAATGTISTGGADVPVSPTAIFLVWEADHWESVDAQSIVGGDDFYCVYAAPGDGAVSIVIQQHAVYMP